MLINKLRLAAISLLGVVALGLGALALARQTVEKQQGVGQAVPVAEPANGASQPAVLQAFGSTAYAPETTVSISRSGFDCRVDRVLVACAWIQSEGGRSAFGAREHRSYRGQEQL